MLLNDLSVHIVDDEEPVRKSLAFMLTAMGFMVRIYPSAAEFLARVPSDNNACLITDVRMPWMSGVELMQQLARMDVRMPTIVITGHGDIPMAVTAMKAGAVDFLEKPFSEENLVEALRRASETLSNHDADSNEALVRSRFTQLSDREREVLLLVVAGLPNKSIGHNLAISPRTVEVHRANIMNKMHARNLPDLVRMAISAGLSSIGREN